MGLTNPGRALGRSSLLLISPKLLNLCGIPPFSINSFRLASLLSLLFGLNLFYLIGALVSSTGQPVTGQYIRWNSFCPMKRKINLISTLVHRALVICSKSTLENELSNIRSILINNGYPEAIINTVMTKKMNQFRRPTQFGPKKCPVYLHLPWMGNVSLRYEMQIKTAVKSCYFAVEPCIVYTTRQLLPVAKKGVLPAFHQSNIVYQFLCHCDSRYVGRTSQRLQHRIKQHVPKTILQKHIS